MMILLVQPLDLFGFFQQIADLANNILIVITSTTDTIDGITFDDDNIISQYMGYAKNAMTAPLYTLLMSMIMASIGLSIFTYFLKGLGYIKNLLPW